MTKLENYYPGLNRVLIEEKSLPEKEGELLSIPDKKFKYGTIIAKGPVKDEKEIGSDKFNVGDSVYILAQSGIDIELPVGKFKLINVQEILVGEKQ